MRSFAVFSTFSSSPCAPEKSRSLATAADSRALATMPSSIPAAMAAFACVSASDSAS